MTERKVCGAWEQVTWHETGAVTVHHEDGTATGYPSAKEYAKFLRAARRHGEREEVDGLLRECRDYLKSMQHSCSRPMETCEECDMVEKLDTALSDRAVPQLHPEREAVIEECARVCEQADADGEGPDCWDWHQKDYARAIRALRSAPAAGMVSVPLKLLESSISMLEYGRCTTSDMDAESKFQYFRDQFKMYCEAAALAGGHK